MSEAKFTPGPWHPEFQGDSDFMAWQVLGSERNMWVAECGCGGNSEACARFIAAAPDMYEALEELLRLLQRVDYGAAIAHAIDRSDATIAKARGKAQ